MNAITKEDLQEVREEKQAELEHMKLLKENDMKEVAQEVIEYERMLTEQVTAKYLVRETTLTSQLQIIGELEEKLEKGEQL